MRSPGFLFFVAFAINLFASACADDHPFHHDDNTLNLSHFHDFADVDSNSDNHNFHNPNPPNRNPPRPNPPENTNVNTKTPSKDSDLPKNTRFPGHPSPNPTHNSPTIPTTKTTHIASDNHHDPPFTRETTRDTSILTTHRTSTSILPTKSDHSTSDTLAHTHSRPTGHHGQKPTPSPSHSTLMPTSTSTSSRRIHHHHSQSSTSSSSTSQEPTITPSGSTTSQEPTSASGSGSTPQEPTSASSSSTTSRESTSNTSGSSTSQESTFTPSSSTTSRESTSSTRSSSNSQESTITTSASSTSQEPTITATTTSGSTSQETITTTNSHSNTILIPSTNITIPDLPTQDPSTPATDTQSTSKTTSLVPSSPSSEPSSDTSVSTPTPAPTDTSTISSTITPSPTSSTTASNTSTSSTSTTSHTTSTDNTPTPTSPPSTTSTTISSNGTITTNPTTGSDSTSSNATISFPTAPPANTTTFTSTDVLAPESTPPLNVSIPPFLTQTQLITQSTTSDLFNTSATNTQLSTSQPTASVTNTRLSDPPPTPILPNNLPARIYPNNAISTNPDKSKFSIIGILFDQGLNWPFVVGNPISASQIFAYMPPIISRALNFDTSNVTTFALQAFVPSAYQTPEDSDKLQTLWLGYIPIASVSDLANAIKAKQSLFYTGIDDPVASALANHVNSGFPIDSVPDPAITSSSSSSSDGGQQRLRIIIGVVVGLGSVVLGVLGFLVYRSFRRRNSHQRLTDPAPDADDIMPTMRQRSGVHRVPVPSFD